MPLDRREQKLIWKRALIKIGKIKQGSFEGSLPLTDSYWKERLDPLHRPNIELQALWNEFKRDTDFRSRDFYTWLAAKEKVPRQQVAYLSDDSVPAYHITFRGTNILFSTEAQQAGMNDYYGELLFVLDADDNFYFGMKEIGTFHHSSILAGAPVKGAGTMIVRHRSITEVNNHSGHYKPGMAEMIKVATALKLRGAAVDAIEMKVYKPNTKILEWQDKAMLLTQTST